MISTSVLNPYFSLLDTNHSIATNLLKLSEDNLVQLKESRQSWTELNSKGEILTEKTIIDSAEIYKNAQRAKAVALNALFLIEEAFRFCSIPRSNLDAYKTIYKASSVESEKAALDQKINEIRQNLCERLSEIDSEYRSELFEARKPLNELIRRTKEQKSSWLGCLLNRISDRDFLSEEIKKQIEFKANREKFA